MDAIDDAATEGGTGGGSPRMPRFLSFMISLAAVLGISMVIAWPLWSLASSSRGVYTIVFAAALAILVIYLAVARARRKRNAARRRALIT